MSITIDTYRYRGDLSVFKAATDEKEKAAPQRRLFESSRRLWLRSDGLRADSGCTSAAVHAIPS